MPYPLADKTVLVTGASSGIGASLAQGFAERGAVVGICARRKDRLEQVLARQLDTGTFEIYVPSWFADLATGKARDVGAFLAGTAAWVRQHHARP